VTGNRTSGVPIRTGRRTNGGRRARASEPGPGRNRPAVNRLTIARGRTAGRPCPPASTLTGAAGGLAGGRSPAARGGGGQAPGRGEGGEPAPPPAAASGRPGTFLARRSWRRARRREIRAARRTVAGRHPLLTAVCALLLILTPVWISLGSALANPGLGSSASARGAEWLRGHGGSSIVNWA